MKAGTRSATANDQRESRENHRCPGVARATETAQHCLEHPDEQERRRNDVAEVHTDRVHVSRLVAAFTALRKTEMNE